MKLFFEYEAQDPNLDTEYWTRIRDEDQDETEEDYISPENKIQASYSAKYFPSDLPIITFFPASRGREIVDINHQHKGMFFLIISNRDNTVEIISEEAYEWGTASDFIQKYSSLLFPKLLKLLPNKGFYVRSIVATGMRK